MKNIASTLTRRQVLAAMPLVALGSALPGGAVAEAAAAPVISAKAREMHSRMFVFDGHVHALDREFYHGGSMGTAMSEGQWDLVRARQGGVGAFFLSIYVPEEYYPGRFETKQTLRRINHATVQVKSSDNLVEFARNTADVQRIRSEGKIAAVLDLEGSYDLDGDLGVLREVHAMGLQSAQLSAHNWDQNYADSCCSVPKWNGLTEHGRKVIAEMNRLGMVVNVSHASDTAIEQAIEASQVPVIATHHGLRRVNDIPRNMPDQLLEKLAASGGVMGFQIGSEFSYPREYKYITEHRRKTFWDTTSIPEAVKGKSIYEVDALVAPGFPMLGADVPDAVMMAVDDWVGVVGPGDSPCRRGSCGAWFRLRRWPDPRARHARCARPAHDYGCDAAARLFRGTDCEVLGWQSATCVRGHHKVVCRAYRPGPPANRR